jgi:hypothetical protein
MNWLLVAARECMERDFQKLLTARGSAWIQFGRRWEALTTVVDC